MNRRGKEDRELLLLSLQGVARTLGLSIETVKELISNGQLGFVIPSGRKRKLVPQSEIDGWIARNLTKIKPDEKTATVETPAPAPDDLVNSGIASAPK